MLERLRSYSSCLFLIAGFGFILAIGAILIWYALPRPDYAEIGPVSDYPPSDTPYLIQRGTSFYLVNDGSRILAIDPINSGNGGCRVNWNIVENIFIDPCRGDWFDLYGQPVRWAEHGLIQYLVEVMEGAIRVDLSRSPTAK